MGSVPSPRCLIWYRTPSRQGPLYVSTGVAANLLLAPIVSVYPRVTVSAHIEGTVKVEAIIWKSGRIEDARAVSGPDMLCPAALDATRNARYSPFMLNGTPSKVETTITVNVKLST